MASKNGAFKVHKGEGMGKRASDPPRVFIAWMSEGGWLSTLAWNGGNGPSRTYVKDQYDARLDLGRDLGKDGPLPCFDDVGKAFRWMTSHWDSKCQVSVGLARLLEVELDDAAR